MAVTAVFRNCQRLFQLVRETGETIEIISGRKTGEDSSFNRIFKMQSARRSVVPSLLLVGEKLTIVERFSYLGKFLTGNAREVVEMSMGIFTAREAYAERIVR